MPRWEDAVDSRTAGYQGWKEVKFFEGKDPDGKMTGSEGFRNIVDGREFIPENGWDGEPPYPTGEPCRCASGAYRRNYDLIEWER